MSETPAGPPPVTPVETPPEPVRSLPPASRAPWILPAAGLALVLCVLVAVLFLRRPEPAGAPAPGSSATATPAAAPPVLAETVGEEGHLSIAVVSLDRVATDMLELRLAVTNTAPTGSPALDISQRFSADGPDRGTLAEVFLADLAHEHKFFVLRDGQNAPLGSRDVTPLGSGERRVLWARYPAPKDEDTEVVVHVPHAEPMPNVPVGQRLENP